MMISIVQRQVEAAKYLIREYPNRINDVEENGKITTNYFYSFNYQFFVGLSPLHQAIGVDLFVLVHELSRLGREYKNCC
jgi:hypothetical protein